MSKRLTIEPFVLTDIISLDQISGLSSACHTTDRHDNTVMHQSQRDRAPRSLQWRFFGHTKVSIDRSYVVADDEIAGILSIQDTTDEVNRVVFLDLDGCELGWNVRVIFDISIRE